MRRRLFTLCSALSLLLCAAVCALWAASYIVPSREEVTTIPVDHPGGTWNDQMYEVESRDGAVSVRAFLIDMNSGVRRPVGTVQVLRFRYTLPAALTAVVPLLWLAFYRSRRAGTRSA